MTDEQTKQLSDFLAAFAAVSGIIAIVTIIVAVIIWWRIFSKAGYSGAMALWTLIPIANLIVILILAFGEWPILRELKALRQQVSSQSSGQYPPYNQSGSGFSGQNYPSGPNYPRQ